MARNSTLAVGVRQIRQHPSLPILPQEPAYAKGVDPHTAKEDLPGQASRFDIYVDKNGNMFGVPKGGKPEGGEHLGNIEES